MIRITNTLSGKKEELKPRKSERNPGGEIGIYVCGVTVYDRCHLGHARSAIVFDVIRRYMEYRGIRVRYVRNFTDVDDKIINRAREEGISWSEVAETYIGTFNEDMARLGVRSASDEPKATEHIPEMLDMIGKLVEKDHAYAVEGNVFYRVRSFAEYGKLSRRDPEELQAGARIEPDERKEDPLDFALWKASKAGEPSWESPWGPGRPGWHIECSAMALGILGDGLDIHGGGKDLIFPHHENEIAQAEGATGNPFARYWIHNGFVNVNQEKMSKSLGNFFTIEEIFEKSPWSPGVTAEVIRYFLLATHYQSPIDFSDQALSASRGGLDNFYRMFQKLEEQNGGRGEGEDALSETLDQFPSVFESAMDDDFNSALAISELHKLRTAVNKYLDGGISRALADRTRSVFRRFGEIFGFGLLGSDVWSASEKGSPGLDPKEIEELVQQRNEARRLKDWAGADVIRKRLA
ncbi:MAG TPA: cysteine--tRNA ligase, partial [Nitrospiria bacterium]|nr:cysteine--tRNA ligase [Nitrospiria bacterium]